MTIKSNIHKFQSTLFPGLPNDRPWDSQTTVKRFFLSFPHYPFRTTRELANLGPLSPFGSSSPIFPAHTQLNITFKKRNANTLINYIVPYNLNYTKGSTHKTLTAAERNNALTFTVFENNTPKDYIITNIEIILVDVYLQV